MGGKHYTCSVSGLATDRINRFTYPAVPLSAETKAFQRYYLLKRLGLNISRVNLLAIVILSGGKCKLSTCTTRYLVAMTMADLLVIITEITMIWIINYYFLGSFRNITHVCSVIGVLSCAAADCSVCFTVTFSFDRFIAICCQKLKTKYCPEKVAVVVLATTCLLLCSKNVPFYFIFESREIIDIISRLCYPKKSYFTEPGWMAFACFDNVLTPLLPYVLILSFNSLTVKQVLVASQVRKGLTSHSKAENCSDAEMVSRRKSVILLFTLSGSFILLCLVIVIEFLYHIISGKEPGYYINSEYIFEHVGDMLRNLSCCSNTFIFGATQSKFREQFKSVVKYPVTSIVQLINKQNN
ncbi:probable G-protein coupled receptor 139 [Heterodontus francisci]|uniref:probable G-protein coupled receptor 139 n=1 Tax=Heterodontus francisci TaxID=7792 RepID=UPI00355C056C